MDEAELFQRAICCGEYDDQCTCGVAYSLPAASFDICEFEAADLVQLFGPPSGLDAPIVYGDHECHDCAYFAEPTCRPLRVWVREFIESNPVSHPAPLQRCKHYKEWVDELAEE